MSDGANLGWGLYPWFQEHGPELIHADDLGAFVEVYPHGKLFQHVGSDGAYLRIAYGPKVFRVRPDLFKSVAVTPIPVGSAVKIIDKNVDAVVEELQWHWDREEAFYILRYGGKRHSRRYWDAELRALTDRR